VSPSLADDEAAATLAVAAVDVVDVTLSVVLLDEDAVVTVVAIVDGAVAAGAAVVGALTAGGPAVVATDVRVVAGPAVDVVVGAGPHTCSTEKNGGALPLPQRHPSTSPSCTTVTPTPALEYLYDDVLAAARQYAQ
jgi:hypothetical protein